MLRDCLVEEMAVNSMSPKPTKYKYNTILRIIDERINRNVLLRHKQRDLLILSSMRKIDVGDGFFRDDYTYWIDKYLNRSHYILDRWDYSKQESSNVLRLDISYFMRKRYGRNNSRLDKRNRIASVSELEQKIIIPIEQYFTFAFTIKQKKTILEIVNYRIIMEPVFNDYYDYLLKKIKPKAVMFSMRGATNSQVLVQAAKRWNIPSIELGHAITDHTYIQSNFHENEEVSTFPDYYLAFGEYEIKQSRWPIDKERVIPVGSPMLDCLSDKYRNNEKHGDKKTILFISNMRESVFVYAKYIAENIDRDKYDVIIKLHPGECKSWQENYGPLIAGVQVDIIDTFDNPIYFYLSIADWVVGLSSNALYEASTFDSKIAIIYAEDTLGHPLLESGNAVLVKQPSELLDCIRNDYSYSKKQIKLYKKNSIENINRVIEEIIK
jgi:hypothetical protein